MTTDELSEILHQWGRAQTGRHEFAERREPGETDGPGSHPISRAREFAPMTRARAAQRIMGRDGADRRRMMAQKANEGSQYGTGLHIVPMAYCDPIRCTETRSSGPAAAVDRGIPSELRHVDRATMDLCRMDTLLGLIVRQEYMGTGYQSEKAERVGASLGSPITLRQYRDGLARAKVWLSGRIGAPLTVT